MPVTSSQIATALAQGLYKPEVIKFESDGNAGQFGDGSTALGADENGVLTYVEVGADAPLEDAKAAYIGQFMPPNRHLPPQVRDRAAGDQFLQGQTRGNRVKARLRTQGGADAQASARFGIGAHKSSTASTPNVLRLQDYQDHDPNGVSNDTEIPVLTVEDFGWQAVAEGEYISVIANPGATGAQTYDYDEGSSTLHLPVLCWDGRGL